MFNPNVFCDTEWYCTWVLQRRGCGPITSNTRCSSVSYIYRSQVFRYMHSLTQQGFLVIRVRWCGLRLEMGSPRINRTTLYKNYVECRWERWASNVDFDRFDELGATIHDIPDKTQCRERRAQGIFAIQQQLKAGVRNRPICKVRSRRTIFRQLRHCQTRTGLSQETYEMCTRKRI